MVSNRMSQPQQLVLYVMNGCPACDSAKAFLTKKGYRFQQQLVRSANQLPAGSDRTVPQLVYNGQLIGGLGRMQEWLKNVPDKQPQPQRPIERPPIQKDSLDSVFESQDIGGRVPTQYIRDEDQPACTFDKCFG